MTQRLISLAQNRYLQHLLFWACSFYALYRLFRYNDQTLRTDLIYTALFHVSLLAVVYLNTQLIIPPLRRSRRYLLFILLSAVLLAAAIGLHYATFSALAPLLFPDFYFISYFSFADILQFHLAYWLLSTLIKLSRAWFELLAKEKEIERLEKEKTQAELQALKAQLDPHFLFNSLNNIYSLALYEDPRTPDALLQLSESMRFVLYDCQASHIPLQQELQHLRRYLQLQSLRSDRHTDISLSVTGSDAPQELLIRPLLLLPLLENAFKHARPTPDGRFFIRATLELNNGQLHFHVANTCAAHSELPAADPSAPRSGGIGLQNLHRRLELLYPACYQLLQQPVTDNTFAISLTLTL